MLFPEDAEMAAYPFPFVVFDALWPNDLLDRVLAEFPEQGWKEYNNPNEYKMEGGAHLWGLATKSLFDALGSQETLSELSTLTGIDGLSMETVGGGYHLIPPGGRLAIHTDFNRSSETGLFRRLNCLIYLNRNWIDAGGRLELWANDDTGDHISIAPEFNRTVIFETSDRSWHGHRVPASRWRASVAAYFYSPEPPRGYTHDHSTVWR